MSLEKQLQIGAVFTPLSWAIFAIRQTKIYEKWLGGSTVFDPTMGEGNLLEALIEIGLDEGKTIDELPTELLFGNEMNAIFYTNAIQKFKKKYGIVHTKNFSNEDIFDLKQQPYDILLGNPPWQNFSDISIHYKEKINSLPWRGESKYIVDKIVERH